MEFKVHPDTFSAFYQLSSNSIRNQTEPKQTLAFLLGYLNEEENCVVGTELILSKQNANVHSAKIQGKW